MTEEEELQEVLLEFYRRGRVEARPETGVPKPINVHTSVVSLGPSPKYGAPPPTVNPVRDERALVGIEHLFQIEQVYFLHQSGTSKFVLGVGMRCFERGRVASWYQLRVTDAQWG